MSIRAKSIRFDDATMARIEAYAKLHKIKIATAARIAICRGLSVLEQDLAAGERSSPLRRRVYSPGVDS